MVGELKASNLVKYLNEINHELITKSQLLSKLREAKAENDERRSFKLSELYEEKRFYLFSQKDHENATELNKAMMNKCSSVVDEVRTTIEKLEEESNLFFEMLGLRVSLDDSSSMKVRLDFKDDNSLYAIFTYDEDTDDFDLIEMYPEHQNFANIKRMLRDSGDFQGFVYMLLNEANCPRD